MKHTPGPWNFDGPMRRIKQNNFADYIAREFGDNSTGQVEANARLIEAAPAMLEALKEAVDLLESYLCEADREASPNGRWPKLRNAIAKAEGDPTP